jgi:putative Holliday junction resolvase
MKIMRVMGLDVGDKRIGIAVSDALLLTAQLRPTLERERLDSDLRRLEQIVRDDEVHEVVVGQPLHMDGRESRQSAKVAKFARALAKSLKIPVVLWDERGTSAAAEEHLEEMGMKWRERRRHVDKMAAAMILQSYLDSRKP